MQQAAVDQIRKETDIPYISNLIAVAGVVLENGGGRDEAIAALLHDSIEDRGHDYPGGVEALKAALEQEGCADKLHNARVIVADLRVMGIRLFDRFKGRREGTLWYYESLVAVFGRRGPTQLAQELRRTVETMRQLAESA